MTESSDTPASEPQGEKKSRFSWLSKMPAHLPGGIRTTTAGLLVLFVLILVLWNSVRYDPTKNENSPVYVPPATTTEVVPTQEYVPTRVPTTTSTPTTTTPSVTPSAGAEPSGAVTTTTTPTTTTPGFQLPTIPGLQLPGQPQTTTPAR